MSLLDTSPAGWQETPADMRKKYHPLQHSFFKGTEDIILCTTELQEEDQPTNQTKSLKSVYLFDANKFLYVALLGSSAPLSCLLTPTQWDGRESEGLKCKLLCFNHKIANPKHSTI